MAILWRCKRCKTLLRGNPIRCPKCGYTIYTPEFPDEKGGEG